MSMINSWINALTKPKETFVAEKANASIGKGVINFLIAGVITGIMTFVIGLVFSMLGSIPVDITSVFSVVLTPIGTIFWAFVGLGISFIIAKILGGQGSFTSLFYLVSLYAVPIALLSWIPVLNILVILYSLYLFFLALKESLTLSTGKAIAVILIPIVLLGILAVILVVLVGAAIFSMFSSIAPTGAFGLT